MQLDLGALCSFCDLVSVATACGPAVRWATERLPGWRTTLVEDGFLFALPPGGRLDTVRALYVAHVDEIGGMVLLPHATGGYALRVIGMPPERLADRPLRVMDYRDDDGSSLRPGRVRVEGDEDAREAVLDADGLSPLGAVCTFDEPTGIEGDWIAGKALDPRVTAFAVIEAARTLSRPDVAVMLVFAEECSMHAARKGAFFAQERLPALSLTVNCDVPGLPALYGAELDEAAIRVSEGGSLIDPHFGLGLHAELCGMGLPLALAHARSGSQTPLFIPQCRAVSLAVAAEVAHIAPTKLSLKATSDLVDVLLAIPSTKAAGFGESVRMV